MNPPRDKSADADPFAEERRPRFLCTNDDGVHARGLALLVEAAERLGEVFVVAPDRQQSASSHSLTLHSPLRATAVSENRLAVDGTPTDCVLLAVNGIGGRKPDFVLSGVNHGPNMGEDVLYSGTVAAAMEATILGIPSIAVSFTGRDDDLLSGYSALLERLLQSLVQREDFPKETFFNINLPDLPAEEVEGYRVTSLGRRQYLGSLTRSLDPAGREFYWIGGGRSRWEGGDDSDFRAVQAGYVSITPMHLDLTNFPLLEKVKKWPLLP